MLGLRRGLEGGKHSDERAIHREISGKESEGEREKWQKQRCEHKCVYVSTCKWSVLRERKIYNPQHRGYARGV